MTAHVKTLPPALVTEIVTVNSSVDGKAPARRSRIDATRMMLSVMHATFSPRPPLYSFAIIILNKIPDRAVSPNSHGCHSQKVLIRRSRATYSLNP